MTPVAIEPVELELHKIKRSMHHDIIRSFRMMLLECEQRAIELNDAELKVQVERWYQQWNRMTGDSAQPRWKKNAS